MENVKELIETIIGENTKDGKQASCTASKKDELRVMRAMMNDTDYQVDVYGNSGKESSFNPSSELRNLCASVISGAAKIPTIEAQHMMQDYEFKRSEAENLIEFSKEYVNTYIHTGRKLPLGGREKSNVSLALKQIPAGTRTYPKVVGVDKKGNNIYAPGKSYIKAYESVKVFAPVPSWNK